MNTPYIENVKENTKYVEVQVCPIFNVHNGDTASFIVEEKKNHLLQGSTVQQV